MTLTWGLVLLAAVVLASVLVHGAWRVRRASPSRRQGEPPTATAPRIEPQVDGDTEPAPPPVPGLRAPLRRLARLDPLIDAIVPIALDIPVSGDHVLASMPASRRAGSKPFHVECLDPDNGEWEAPTPGRVYGELQAGVQLANRSGALNEIEYSEFVQKLQALADGVGGMPDFPDMLDVVARARELDAFAHPVDAQLTITLRSDAVAWSVGYVRQCAARHGFVDGSVPGRLALPAAQEGDPPVLVISFDPQAALADDPQQAAVREIQLSLDVPQTAAEVEPFPAWHGAARALGDDMAATAVDDFGEPITLHAFNTIGQELQALYTQLEAHGMPAGSAAARRLFS